MHNRTLQMGHQVPGPCFLSLAETTSVSFHDLFLGYIMMGGNFFFNLDAFMYWVVRWRLRNSFYHLENFKYRTFGYINRIYVVWLVSLFPSHISSIDTHMGIKTVNPTHMLVLLSNAVGSINFYVISLARVPTFQLCVRQVCMDIRKNCYRSVVTVSFVI